MAMTNAERIVELEKERDDNRKVISAAHQKIAGMKLQKAELLLEIERLKKLIYEQ